MAYLHLWKNMLIAVIWTAKKYKRGGGGGWRKVREVEKEEEGEEVEEGEEKEGNFFKSLKLKIKLPILLLLNALEQ